MLDLELSMLQSEHTDVLSYVALSFISSHSPRLIVCPLSYFNSLPEQTLVASAATLSDMHTQMEHATGCLAAAQAKEKDGAVIQLYRLYVEALRQLIADKTAQQEHARVRVGAAMDMKGAVEGRLAGGGSDATGPLYFDGVIAAAASVVAAASAAAVVVVVVFHCGKRCTSHRRLRAISLKRYRLR